MLRRRKEDEQLNRRADKCWIRKSNTSDRARGTADSRGHPALVAAALLEKNALKRVDFCLSITAGVSYDIQGDSIKLMGNYIHTKSDFRAAHSQFGDDQFDEFLLRLQLMF